MADSSAFQANAPIAPTAVNNKMYGSGANPVTGLTGATINVPVSPASALQTAITAAINADGTHKGQTLVVPAGVTYSAIVTPQTVGTGWTRIVSGGSSLPAAGTRVSPSNAGQMFKVQSSGLSPGGSGTALAVEIPDGSPGWWFIGMECEHPNSNNQTGLVSVNDSRTIFERCYFHGKSTAVNLRRCLRVFVGDFQIWDSWLSDAKELGADSQAIYLNTFGTGPKYQRFHIENCYLSGAGENVLLNDQDAGSVLFDVTLSKNHFFKPLSWHRFLEDGSANSSWDGVVGGTGQPWVVKNLLEVKWADRVLVEGNTFENMWLGAQDGTAVLVYSNVSSTVNQTTRNIRIQHNELIRVGHAFSTSWGTGGGGNLPGNIGEKVAILNNRVRQCDGRLALLNWTGIDYWIEHNTVVPQTGTVNGTVYIQKIDATENWPRLTIRDNTFGKNGASLKAAVFSTGNATVDATTAWADTHIPNRHFLANAVYGQTTASGLTGFTTYTTSTAAGINTTTGVLSGGSPLLLAGHDSTDIGVNFTTLNAAQTGTVALPIPSFSPAQTAGTLTIVFTDTNTGGTATSWAWSGPDAFSSTSQNPSHTFSSAGTKSVTVTMTNAAGSATVTQAVVVSAITTTVPVHIAMGTKAEGTGALTVVWPTHIANDVGLLFIETANEVVTPTTSGWAEVLNSPQGTGTAGAAAATRLTVYWKRATTTTESNVAIPTSGNHQVAAIAIFRNCQVTGNPWDVTAGSTAASSGTIAFPTITPTINNTYVVCAYAWDTASADPGVNTSAGSLTGLTSPVRLGVIGTTSGNGGGFLVAGGTLPTAATLSSMTWGQDVATVQGKMSIALAPAVAGGSATLTATTSPYSFTGEAATLTALQSQTLTAVSVNYPFNLVNANLFTLGTTTQNILYPIRVKEFLPGRRASAVIRASVPPANQEEYANASYISIHPLTTSTELAALRTGSIVEKLVTFPAKNVTTDAQFKALALAAQQAYQTEITAEVTSTFTGPLGYEGTYDGTTWV